eukprot:scaffold9119_cov32-Tisochrysis_lutea.AAC.5
MSPRRDSRKRSHPKLRLVHNSNAPVARQVEDWPISGVRMQALFALLSTSHRWAAKLAHVIKEEHLLQRYARALGNAAQMALLIAFSDLKNLSVSPEAAMRAGELEVPNNYLVVILGPRVENKLHLDRILDAEAATDLKFAHAFVRPGRFICAARDGHSAALPLGIHLQLVQNLRNSTEHPHILPAAID